MFGIKAEEEEGEEEVEAAVASIDCVVGVVGTLPLRCPSVVGEADERGFGGLLGRPLMILPALSLRMTIGPPPVPPHPAAPPAAPPPPPAYLVPGRE